MLVYQRVHGWNLAITMESLWNFNIFNIHNYIEYGYNYRISSKKKPPFLLGDHSSFPQLANSSYNYGYVAIVTMVTMAHLIRTIMGYFSGTMDLPFGNQTWLAGQSPN